MLSRGSLDPMSVRCPFGPSLTLWGASGEQCQLFHCRKLLRKTSHRCNCFDCGWLDVVLSSDAIAGMAKNADTLKSGCKPASKAVPTLPLNSCFLEWIPPSGDGKGPIFANGFIGLPARKEIPSYVIVQINQSREDEAVCLHYGGLRPPHRCTHSVYVASQD